MLTPAEQHRYSRHLRLPQIGERGQERLRDARVLLLGLGGLGSPAALYLAAAGVGTIGIAEYDTVALHNLQRQILFREADTGAPKLEAGIAALHALNPHINFVAHPGGLTPANALALVAAYDLVLDGTDNFATRFLANDAAVLTRRPLIHGSIFQCTGQSALFDTATGGPCYRCLFPEIPDPESVPTCEQAGVFGALCGFIGSQMAMEAVKFITGAGVPLRRRLLMHDLLAATTSTTRLSSDPACPVCGKAPRIRTIEANNYIYDGCTATCAAAASPPLEIPCENAAPQLAAAAPLLLLDVRRGDERAICHITGSLHIPLDELTLRLGELPPGVPVVVYCHHGQRSLQAVHILREKGFLSAVSLCGGIDRWAATIAPAMPRY